MTHSVQLPPTTTLARYRTTILLCCLLVSVIASVQLSLGTFSSIDRSSIYVSLFRLPARDLVDASGLCADILNSQSEELKSTDNNVVNNGANQAALPVIAGSLKNADKNTLILPSDATYLPPVIMGIVLMNRTTFQCETYGVFGVHDQKHGSGPKREDFDRLFRLFYLSMCESNLNGVIFHDLDNSWVSPYELNQVPGAIPNCNVKFVYVDVGQTPLHTFDLRWHLYGDYLKTHRHEYVVATDVSDVRFDDDPFPYMHAEWLNRQTALFLGLDDDFPDHSDWFKTRYDHCHLDYKPYGKQSSLNAGVVGGRYEAIIWLMERMTNMSTSFLNRKLDKCLCLTSDMIVLNDIFYNQDTEQKDNSVIDRQRWHDTGIEINPNHVSIKPLRNKKSPFVPEGTDPVPWRWMTGRPFVGPYRNPVRVSYREQYIRHKTNINRTEEMKATRTPKENEMEDILYTNYNMLVEKDAKKKKQLVHDMARQAADQIRRMKSKSGK